MPSPGPPMKPSDSRWNSRSKNAAGLLNNTKRTREPPGKMMNILIYIALAANLAAFLQMAIDKRLAVKGKSRIPEAQLIAPALLGGFPGVLLGMLLFRHKTVKRSFQLKLLLAVAAFASAVYVLRDRIL